jgi:hypothetical protein
LTEIQNEGPKPAVLHHLVQTGILAGALLLFAAMLIWRGRPVLRKRATLLLILPVLVGYAGAAFSHFPYNVRYTLPALFGFLGLIGALPLMVPQRCLWRGIAGLILAINLCADGQWFFRPNYRKNDSRAVAQWLATHSDTVKSWTVLPDYLGYSVRWYLGGDQAVLAEEQRPKQEQSTSFPPVPDVLIIGRRHHVKDPDAVIGSYRKAAGEVREVNSFAGFELYVREKK